MSTDLATQKLITFADKDKAWRTFLYAIEQRDKEPWNGAAHAAYRDAYRVVKRLMEVRT